MYITDIKVLYAGYCTHAENIMMQGGRKKQLKLPAIFVLIKHNIHGYILFDTGYSDRFFSETTGFPYNIYAKLTPVFLKENESAKSVLLKEGIQANDINYVIISHFHADHICGLNDFENAKFIYNAEAYHSVKGTNAYSSLKNGFLSRLIPDDFERRSLLLSNKKEIDILEKLKPFRTGYDLFGDGSIILVDLPGHTKGQIGAFISKDDCNEYFLVADAVWLTKAYKELRPPNNLARIIINNKTEYLSTFRKINELSINKPNINIVPSHCLEVLGVKTI